MIYQAIFSDPGKHSTFGRGVRDYTSYVFRICLPVETHRIAIGSDLRIAAADNTWSSWGRPKHNDGVQPENSHWLQSRRKNYAFEPFPFLRLPPEVQLKILQQVSAVQ
ncbi:hypothetical protein COOONC_17469 [Cooperia oncophora]